MKYFYILLLPCIFIISCSKKNNNASQPHASIVWKWTLVGDTSFALGTSRIIVKTIPGTTIQFNGDGSGSEHQPTWQGEAEFNGSFTYSITSNGQTLYINWPEIDTGNIHQQANSDSSTILKLTDHILTLRSYEPPAIGSPDGTIYYEMIHLSR